MSDATTAKWWENPKASPENLGAAVFSAYNSVLGNCKNELIDDIAYLQTYNGTMRPRYAANSYQSSPRTSAKAFSYNVTRSCVDTINAKVAQSDVKVSVITDQGDYHLQQRARAMDELIEGIFYINNLRIVGPATFRDAEVVRFAACQVYEPKDHKGSVRIERVHPGELYVDPDDAKRGDPRSMYRSQTRARDVLMGYYSDAQAKKAIADAPAHRMSFGAKVDMADSVEVVEAWHLPSTADRSDGLWTLSVNGYCLERKAYDEDDFPFEVVRYQEAPSGYAGNSLVSQLYGQQQELDRLVRVQQMSLYLNAMPRWYLNRSSRINKVHLNNEIGAIIEGDGPPPMLIAPEPVPEQLTRQIENIVSKMFNDAGISQLAATSEKPNGLKSGEALQTYHDINSERFAIISKTYEQFYLGLARRVIRLIRKIYKRDGKFSVKVPGSKWLNTVDWSKASLEDEAFHLKVFPTNLLPKTPEGRIDAVTQLAEAGRVPSERLNDLLDLPDLAEVNSLETAALRCIEWNLSKILDEGEYIPPDETQDLNLGVKIATQKINLLRTMKVDPKRLAMLRDWRTQAQSMLAPSPQPAPTGPVDPTTGKPADAGMPASPGAPLGVPGAPPVSPLLPTTPQ